ncbi:toll-like receptor 4 [Mytilus californianus]|uniref:toll-like receptor 4 n=1 Tax=Mytilus californianus TaxID=6549 RepID=UPI00224624F3|nr:toll-like receptor 4 [Mytilus californianus]
MVQVMYRDWYTLLIRMLIYIFPAHVTFPNIPCDIQCRCWENLHTNYSVCSGSNLTKILNIPADTNVLNLNRNAIMRIRSRAFQNLNRLTDLDISKNRLKHLEKESFYGLGNLKTLCLQNNFLSYKSTFPKGIFKPLQSLIYLNIKFNANSSEPDNFSDETISDLVSLENLELDIADKSSWHEPFLSQFSTLKHLKKLTRGLCELWALRRRTFINVIRLQYLDLSTCPIQLIYNGFLSKLSNLRHFDVSNIVLFIDEYLLLFNEVASIQIQQLVMANTSDCVISNFPVSVFKLLNNTGLEEFYLNNNVFSDASGNQCEDVLPASVRLLDFSSNRLMKFCFHMPFLKNLYLQNNSLGSFLRFNPFMRSTTSQLESVDLSFNNIYGLKFSIFQGHTQLQTLNLSNNNLHNIDFDISKMKVLKQLDLSNNFIGTFSQDNMDTFTNMFKVSSLRIDLGYNVLRCGCLSTHFLRWMLNNNNHFHNSIVYTCKFENGTSLLLDDLSETVLQLEKECDKHIVIIIVVTIGIAFSAITLTAGLAYRYRWKIRYIYYITKGKYTKLKHAETNKIYLYDAFISYADREQNFIINECIPNLEENGNKKLCIHQRDFIPGVDITLNITNAIHDSKKTIYIITRAFLDSYYCMFEFNMARMESIYSRRGENILFLILHEQIPSRELPLVMLEIVQRQSYIEYPNDEQGDVVFWDKIRETLT